MPIFGGQTGIKYGGASDQMDAESAQNLISKAHIHEMIKGLNVSKIASEY
jgi:hypothetical protein